MTRQRIKNSLMNIVKVVFAGALITWLVRSGRFDLKSLRQLLDPQFIASGLALVLLSTSLMSERWRSLLQAQGFHLTPLQTFRLTLVGIFFNFAMPGGVGGDLIKGYYVVKSQHHRKFDSAMTILMDRVFGLYIMIVMATAAVIVGFDRVWNHPQLHILVWIIGFLFAVASAGLAAGFSARGLVFARRILPSMKITQRLFQIWEGLLTYRRHPGCLYKVLLFSLVGQLIYVGFFIHTGAQMGFGEVAISTYFISCLMGTMITAIPISPAGIGVGQAAFGFLFSELAAPLAGASTLGASLATASQIFQLSWGLVGAFFYIQMKAHTSPSSPQGT